MQTADAPTCTELRRQTSRQAGRFRQQHFLALAASLFLGCAAAFVALLPGAGPISVAAALLVVSLAIQALDTRLAWEEKWHRARDSSETLKSQSYLFQFRARPFDCPDDAAAERLAEAFQRATSVTPRVDPSWLETRQATDLGIVKALYRSSRLQNQIDYYARNIELARRLSRVGDALAVALMVVAVLTAVFEVAGVVGVEAVGAFIAAASAARTWVVSKHYADRSRVFQRAADSLGRQVAALEQCENAEQFADFVAGTEQILAGESAQWLAISNARLALVRNEENTP